MYLPPGKYNFFPVVSSEESEIKLSSLISYGEVAEWMHVSADGLRGMRESGRTANVLRYLINHNDTPSFSSDTPEQMANATLRPNFVGN